MPTASRNPLVVGATEGRRLNILGHGVRLVLGEAHTAGASYVMDVETPPGHGIPPHVHTTEDEVIRVLEGEFEIFVGGAIHHAGPGATLDFPIGVPHGFRNVGAGVGRTLWFVTPGANFEAFFEKLNALPPGGPPDMEVVARIFGEHGMTVLPPAST